MQLKICKHINLSVTGKLENILYENVFIKLITLTFMTLPLKELEIMKINMLVIIIS